MSNTIKLISAAAIAGSLLAATPLRADDAIVTSVGDLYRDKAALSGKRVAVRGEVVKVNNGIMRRNFVHVQDGSGDAADGSNNLIVTTEDTAMVGDRVNVEGTMVLDRDFGYGYRYPVLVEQARVTKTQ